MKLKQIIFIIFFICILLIIPFLTKDKKVTFDEIETVLEPYIDQEIVHKADSNTLYNNYKINANSLEEYISYGPVSYMNVQEITIFKEKDKNQRTLIVKKIKEYIDKKITTFEGYGPNQVELLKNAIVEVEGDYVFCIILENNKSLWQDIVKLF